MLEGINLVAVLVSTILAMAVGSIWYSPLLFGTHWMRAVGLTERDLERSTAAMPKLLAYGFVANFVILFVLAQFVAYFTPGTMVLSVSALLFTLFVSAFLANAVIWEEKPLAYLFINAGYAAVVIFGGMTVLWHWPW